MNQEAVPPRLWENARVLSMADDSQGTTVTDGRAVLAAGDCILAVGPRSELTALPETGSAERLDCADRRDHLGATARTGFSNLFKK